MAEAAFANFGDLYRAALAECDPEKKSQLLHQVQIALVEWQRNAESLQTYDAGYAAVWNSW